MRYITILFIFLCSFAALGEDLIRVAIIDTGINPAYVKNVPLCATGSKDFSGQGFEDTHGHGTNVTGLIVTYANTSGYCIVLIKAYNFQTHKVYETEALEYARKINVDIVNYSGGGHGQITRERNAVMALLKDHTILMFAAGNEEQDLDEDCNFYPACYDSRIIVVGANLPYSNHGKRVHIIEEGNEVHAFGVSMRGTSQATAIATGKLINKLVKRLKNR